MQEAIKILMLEDNLDDAELVQRVLRRNELKFSMHVVDSKEGFLNELETFRPDMILCDHGIPQFNSLDALKLFKDSGLTGPFVLVTGTVSEEFAVDVLKRGADDYILKSNLSRLPSAISNALSKRHEELIRKSAEMELAKQNQLLSGTVERLERVNNELDHFLYSVSHNLRAPLSSVLGLINLSKLGGDTDHATLMLLMEQSINRLDVILKDILSYSFNANGEVSYELLDIEQEFYLAVQHLQYFPGWNHVKFKSDVKSNARFYSDSFRIRLVLTNLIMNSIYFRDESKTNSYCALHADISKESATIRITDNGIGIEPEFRERVFQMFFKASNRSDGAGLGLYLVNEAVRKLKGSLEIESTPGEGTSLLVSLPNKSTA
jgi:signal transduction histidine kinase